MIATLANDLPNGYLYDMATETLNQAFWGDQQFIKVLNAISKGTPNVKLKTECEDHAKQIDTQFERLRAVSRITNIQLHARENLAMRIVLDEAMDILVKIRSEEAMDTVLTCAAQNICRMRMAIYSNVSTYLGLMEFETAEMLIEKTNQEEYLAEDRLQSIAYEKLLPITKPAKRKGEFWGKIWEFFTG